jgi:hypothetical protein
MLKNRRTGTILLSHLVCALVSLQLGALVSPQTSKNPACPQHPDPHQEVADILIAEDNSSSIIEETADDSSLFPSSMTKFFSGVSSMNRTDFAASFPLGAVAKFDTKPSRNQLVMMFLPGKTTRDLNHQFSDNVLSNCPTVKVVYNSLTPQNRKTCTALVTDGESFDAFNWVRPIKNASASLYRAGRYNKHDGQISWSMSTPNRPTSIESMDEVQSYLSQLLNALEELKPIAERVAKAGNGTIIALACNYGEYSTEFKK